MTILEELGAFVARPQPRPARDLVPSHLLDTVGAWLAASRTREAQALLRLRADLARDGAAGLGADIATHCAIARLSEIDDIELSAMTTAGGIVVPAALAIAAAAPPSDPAALADAILAGYDCMIRLGRAIDGPAVLYRGIWPTYLAAPLGVAAVAARLFGFDARTAAHALALALTRAAPGVGHHNAVTTSRWTAVGQAAESGLAAARAARAGFTSDLALLDGGFLPGVYAVKPDRDRLLGALGQEFALATVSYKPWCAARQTMAATQALIELMQDGLEPEAIQTIAAHVLPPHHKMIAHGVVAGDRASHLTSLPYCLAVAALAPALALDIDRAPDTVPERVAALMARIEVRPDEGLPEGYPAAWPARIEVTTAAESLTRTVTHVPGDPGRPFDAAAVRAKFRRFAGPVAGAGVDAIEQHCVAALASPGGPAALMRMIEKSAAL